MIVVSATVAVISPLTRTLCAAATILHTSAPPTRPPPTPAGAAATGKGAHKMRRCARTLRRPAHGPCPHPPQPAPLSPPDAHATLVPGPVAALSPRPRARCRLRIGALYLPQRECVLDVGRVPTGGSQPRRPLLKSRFHRVDRALPTGRCLSLHPVLCLPARVPMSSTHSRPNRRIGAPYVPQAAHVMRPTTSIHVWDRRILCAFLHVQGPQIVALFWYYGGSNGPRIMVPTGLKT